MENKKRSGIGSMILAVIILVLGVGFGMQRILVSVSAYSELPSNKEIRGMEEYLELMEDLEELLDDPSEFETMNVEDYLDDKLEDSKLTSSQERDIRELYDDMLAEGAGGSMDQEMAQNSLTREIVYYRQQIPNPEQTRIHMRNMLIMGSVSIVLSLVLFIVLMKKAAAKRNSSR